MGKYLKRLTSRLIIFIIFIMNNTNDRRKFLKALGLGTLGLAVLPTLPIETFAAKNKKMFFDISLAEWSLHKTLFAGEMTNMQFPEVAKKVYGINAVEYVNAFFKDKATDFTYLKELRQRAKDNGVKNVLIMIDGEGSLADVDKAVREKAVENHYKWVEAAKFLGCHAIRVNAAGKGTPEEMKNAAIESLSKLSEFGASNKIKIVVENHGGLSSDGAWLSSVLAGVNMKNCGSLPDFGNFYEYDRYQGVADLMPFAKGVSAKSIDFDANGNETTMDYKRLLTIVKNAGFKGFVGIEYEGTRLSEDEGIKATKRLLERVGKELS
jgi:sugar phosphate isomerase/epimerase